MAPESEKKTMIQKVNDKTNKICSACSSWNHEREACKFNEHPCGKCKAGKHMEEFCSVKHLFVCSMMRSGGSLMCLQDVKVGKEGLKVARCMFDGGSEGTLILDSFAKAQNFRYI